MALLFGWLAYFSLPIGFIVALITKDFNNFAIAIMVAMYFAAAAIMMLEPRE